MSKEIKRVPLDFDYPLNKIWNGYLNPFHSCECAYCEGTGCSPEAMKLKDHWYGVNGSDFHPSRTGNKLWSAEDEVVRQIAKRNIGNVCQTIDVYVFSEAERLASLFNSKWSCNLDMDDVYALCLEDRLWEFTREFITGKGCVKKRWETKRFWCTAGKESVPQINNKHDYCWCGEHQVEMILLEPDDVRLHVPSVEEVNRWAIEKGHDQINAIICIRNKCQRQGIPYECDRCNGSGEYWYSEEVRLLHKNWIKIEPPAGEGWQVWETVSEGSPISPVFMSKEALLNWVFEEREKGNSFFLLY